ncbi:aerotaxis receptor [Oryzomicrobium terrae]|uniref:Aerotaxis receptor n=1 Tax=Oryzomicrobium terrae TaxID=1735038 RepID=A0A5C1E9J9_9RHOO|nr:PAS domain-containing methyl-accepting chemotaxis protein [Oryzomicrobium terrae]QEL65309.1 aerotaxis receptor [Oryzomicrobium terrae]
MKVNLPVTGVERMLSPGRPIVTKTDLKGCITYANDAFVQISGFSAAELIGQNHNVVRHPDMPPEAFADLWSTVKAGLAWRGLVKNRCKNGDHYWVEAYVTPITEGGRTVGYMSVRSKPGQAEVQAAESLYAAVRQQQARLPATATQRHRLSIKQSLVAFSLVLAALPLIATTLPAPWLLTMSVGNTLVALIFAWWLLNNVRLPLKQANAMIRELSEGRLNAAFAPQHRFKLNRLTMRLQSLRVNLRAIFADVLAHSRQVEEEAHSIETQIQRITTAARQQAEHVESVSVSMEELSAASADIASHAGDSYRLAEEALAEVDNGTAQMAETRAVSQQVLTVVESLRGQLDSLGQSVGQIGSLSDAIREIADQTNLLALNASIEAARAGEAGRGFAVVADEVRKLAERTSNCTGDIAATLVAVGRESQAALATMGEAAVEIQRSGSQIERCDQSLALIRSASESARRASEEIRSMLQQQATLTEGIAQTMEQFRQNLEQGVENVEAVGGSVTVLARTADEQYQLIRHLEGQLG